MLWPIKGRGLGKSSFSVIFIRNAGTTGTFTPSKRDGGGTLFKNEEYTNPEVEIVCPYDDNLGIRSEVE